MGQAASSATSVATDASTRSTPPVCSGGNVCTLSAPPPPDHTAEELALEPGQIGQEERGFAVGGRTFGCRSVLRGAHFDRLHHIARTAARSRSPGRRFEFNSTVEPAGVEPASANRSPGASTCVFRRSSSHPIVGRRTASHGPAPLNLARAPRSRARTPARFVDVTRPASGPADPGTGAQVALRSQCQ